LQDFNLLTIDPKGIESFIRIIPAAVAILDQQMNILAVSNQWLEVYKVEKQNVIGKSYYQVFPETLDNSQWIESHKRSLSGKIENSPWDILVHPCGQIDYIKWENRPWHTPQGTLGGIMMVTEVLTGIFNTKRILDQQDLLFKSIEHKSKIGYWCIDFASNTLSWSEQVYKIHGLTRENYTPTVESAIQFYHPEDIPQVRENLNNTMLKGEEFNFKCRIIKTDGTIAYVHAYGVPVIDNDQVVSILGCIGDITETYEKAQEIKRQQDFLKQILDEIPDFISVRDAALKIRLANKAFLSFYDKSEAQIIGTTTFEEYPKEQQALLLQEDQKIMDKGFMDYCTETTLPKKSVTQVLHTKKVRFEDRNGEKFLLSIAQDLTELAMAKKELEQSNQELENFAEIISHDLKEPLRGINSYATILRSNLKGTLSEADVKMLDRISALCGKINTLLEELLYYSQVGRVGLSIQLKNISEIVSQVIDLHQEKIMAENVDIRFDENMPTLAIDHIRLGEVFGNLILNAIKYNKSNKKRITIGVTSHPKAANQPVFFVKDNGIGIKKKFYDDIFTIFYRLHAPQDYDHGSGAGLTIVKKIIECHGGKIWVESVVGKGSTFYFTLTSPPQEH
jgi:PAS domain S-box-containing protein